MSLTATLSLEFLTAFVSSQKFREQGGVRIWAVHRCFAASLIAVANAAAPPKVTVKTGLSLSTMRLQTRFTGRIMSGFNRSEPKKIIVKTNLNKDEKDVSECKANVSMWRFQLLTISAIPGGYGE